DRSVCVEGGLRHGVRRRDGGVAGTAWVAVPFVVAPRRGWASVVFPRHTPERTRAARAQRRGNGTCSRRLRVGRGGPLVSGCLCAALGARPPSAAVWSRRRRRAARTGATFAPAKRA